MDARRNNLGKIYLAAGLFGMSMSAIVGLTERESDWKWAAVAVFFASCPLVLRIDKWMPKDPSDLP